jgi:hypothetical protein
MLQTYVSNVLDILYVRYKMFYMDVAKNISGCSICCNGCMCMLEASVPNVSSVFYTYVASVFFILNMFHTYIVCVLFRCCVCFTIVSSVFFVSVSDACFKCFIYL